MSKRGSKNSDPTSEQSAPDHIRLRAFIIGLLLIPGVGYWIFQSEVVRYTFATWAAPFYNAIFVLFVLTLLNMAVGRIWGWRLFNRIELLCIYAMVSIASALLATDMVGMLVLLMGHPTRYATPSNQWAGLFQGILPKRLMVTDSSALRAFYEGGSTLFIERHIHAWLIPSLWWMVFISAFFIAFLALSVLLRKQWTDSEKLTFPIVQLPLAMTENSDRFFGDKLMWLGFCIAAAITILNGIHYLYPTVPELPIKRREIPLFVSPPFNAVSSIRISFYFFAITLGFLMPLDLSVSCWLFYFLYLGERISVAALGYSGEVPYLNDQAFGAYAAMGLFALWGIRGHLSHAFRRAFLKGDKSIDADEPASYRTAYLALALSLAVMVVFVHVAGMTIGVSLLFIGILVLLAIAISRIRCELGFPVHDLERMGPHLALTRLGGTDSFSRSTLGAFTMFYWATRSFRTHPMPHQLEDLKLAEDSPSAMRGMLRAILAAGLFTIPICFLIHLNGYYNFGAATARVDIWRVNYGAEAFTRLESWLKSSESPIAGRWIAVAAGSAIAVALAIVRKRIVGFPLHPLGYAVANSWGMVNLWLPIMIGSVCKGVLLKVGGLRIYRKAVMFFFGLMLGEFVTGCSWTLLGIFSGIRTYDFWP